MDAAAAAAAAAPAAACWLLLWLWLQPVFRLAALPRQPHTQLLHTGGPRAFEHILVRCTDDAQPAPLTLLCTTPLKPSSTKLKSAKRTQNEEHRYADSIDTVQHKAHQYFLITRHHSQPTTTTSSFPRVQQERLWIEHSHATAPVCDGAARSQLSVASNPPSLVTGSQMAVDVHSPPIAQRQTTLLNSPLLGTTTKGSPSTGQRALTHVRNRSSSVTFHPTVRATHQRNLSRSLSIVAPPSAASVHSHTYVPSQRATQPPAHPTTTTAQLAASPVPPAAAATATPAVAPKPQSAASLIHRASLTDFDSSSYKVLLVGAPHSGKTSLLHRLIAQHFDDGYEPTQRIELALYLLRDEQFNSLEVRAPIRRSAAMASM